MKNDWNYWHEILIYRVTVKIQGQHDNKLLFRSKRFHIHFDSLKLPEKQFRYLSVYQINPSDTGICSFGVNITAWFSRTLLSKIDCSTQLTGVQEENIWPSIYIYFKA